MAKNDCLLLLSLSAAAALKSRAYWQLEEMIEQLYGWRSVLFYH